ncbi:dynein axonemal intermediate chain 7 homolog isoform X1 [Mya arenaria]|uniref:dynein axonemal intermediate chain 7 homolog isoform X1 n=1 Tax=Mya arenaria TaxID=6604 RepID=UPI0022E35D8B|nr:dynein axonemal intermediate chain 7 homolog isoform X1 [Mya arenaria]
MPPKQGSAGKKKLSKAEKEKLKAEEEERKAVEEEEARQKAEEEEKERKEKEKLEEAEKRKLENAEKENRRQEMLALTDLQEGNQNRLNELNNDRRRKAKWARYMRCDGSPDPTIPGEINTYINLRLEDSKHNDIDSVLKQGDLDLSLINELDYLLEDTPESELDIDELERYKSRPNGRQELIQLLKHTREDLQQLIQTKLDAATVMILGQATDLCDTETFNLHYLKANSEICLCIWGNLSKNPRIKLFEFKERGFQFEIPRLLTLSDVGFRVLLTQYDHYSSTCKSYYPRKKKKEEPIEEVKEEVQEQEKKEEEEEKGDEAAEEGAEKEDTEDLMAMLRQMKGEAPPEEEEKVEEVEKAEDVEEFEDPITPEPPEWEDFDEDEDVMDLRANHVLGGVFHFNLMQLPPQPKTVNNWVITRLVDPPVIEYVDYVADTMNPLLNKEGASPSQEKEKAADTQKRDEKPPIAVTLRLPMGCLFTEEPQVARWDDKKKHWRQDGFTDFKYNEETRMFSFKTAYFGTMALLQDAHINMPFQSWELRPHKTNSAVLTIIAAIIEIEIEIKDAMCCLSKPDDKPELEHIKGRWLTPKDLIKTLRKAGINVFPADDSAKYVSIQDKHPVIEEWCYEQIALAASAYAFSWSKWNSETQDREKLLFQGAESLEDQPLPEEDWSLFLMTKRRSLKLKMTEFDDAYSEDYAEGTAFKSNLYHLLTEYSTKDARERIMDTNFEFTDCVHQLLSATKVLTYA